MMTIVLSINLVWVAAIAATAYVIYAFLGWATQRVTMGCSTCPDKPWFGLDDPPGRPLYAWQWARWQAHRFTRKHRDARKAKGNRYE